MPSDTKKEVNDYNVVLSIYGIIPKDNEDALSRAVYRIMEQDDEHAIYSEGDMLQQMYGVMYDTPLLPDEIGMKLIRAVEPHIDRNIRIAVDVKGVVACITRGFGETRHPIHCPRCGLLLGYFDENEVGIDGAKPKAWDAEGNLVPWPIIGGKYHYTDGNEMYDFPAEVYEKFDFLCQKCVNCTGTPAK